MKRYGCGIALATVLLAGSTAWGQSTGTDTSTQTDVGLGQTIKLGIRSTMAQVVVGMIHSVFTDLRSQLGMPAIPTDPTTDFLTILETTIGSAVTAALMGDMSS